jgi:hypothetical protein
MHEKDAAFVPGYRVLPVPGSEAGRENYQENSDMSHVWKRSFKNRVAEY